MDLGAWTVDMGRGPEAAVPKAWPVLGDAANAGVDESHGTHDAGSSVRRSSKPVQRYSSSGTEPLNFVLSCLCLGAFRSMQAMGPWARGPSLWQPGLTRTSSRSFDTSRAPLEAQQDSFGQTFSSSSSPSSPSSSSSSRKEKSRRARSRTCALVGDGGASLRGFFLYEPGSFGVVEFLRRKCARPRNRNRCEGRKDVPPVRKQNLRQDPRPVCGPTRLRRLPSLCLLTKRFKWLRP